MTAREGSVERLSGLEALFLQLETPSSPMHNGALALFGPGPLQDRGGRVRIRAVRTHLEGRLHAAPKLRRRARTGGLGRLFPTWVDDEAFDLERHVCRRAVPPPGGLWELAEACSALVTAPLDRHHPLWELCFFDGLEDGGVALVVKVHHALADGLADVDLATVLFDEIGRPARERQGRFRPLAPPGPARLLADAAAARVGSVGRAALGGVAALRHPASAARSVAELADGLAAVVSPASLAPPSSLNCRVGAMRRVLWCPYPLGPLEAVRRRAGATVNDLVLTAVAGGVGALYRSRGEDAREVQVLVPVGMPRGGEGVVTNRLAAMIARLPAGPLDPVRSLEAVVAEMARRKAHHQALVGQLAFAALDPLPPVALAGVAQVVHHQPVVNLVVTNVPGPPGPLSLMGSELRDVYAFVPLARNLSLGVAAVTYGGKLHLGLVADPVACPDVHVALDGMVGVLDALAGGPRRGGTATAVPPGPPGRAPARGWR